MKVIRHKIDPLQKYCDHYRQAKSPITDCEMPYGKRKPGAGGLAQWFGLCEDCISATESRPEPYVTLETYFTPSAPLVAVEASSAGGKKSPRKPRECHIESASR